MFIIQSTHLAHTVTCTDSEMNRQGAVAAAIAAGGGSATVAGLRLRRL